MKERSVSEVRKNLAVERKQRDRIISRQSFYCSSKRCLVSPSQCHDCFLALPYTERLLRWAEDRMRCIAHHRQDPGKERTNKMVTPQVCARSADTTKSSRVHSVEEHVAQGMLDFILELDDMTDRFQKWWQNLARPARDHIHRSKKLQEAIGWFGHRLEEFRQSVVMICRSPEELKDKNHTKEE